MLNILALIALVSSFTATAAVSVPAAIGGLAVKVGIDKAINLSKAQIINFASNQGSNQTEGEKFSNTAKWLFDKIDNIRDVFKFSKNIADPLKSISSPKILKTHTKFDNYAEIALAINQSSKAYSKSQKANLLSDVLAKLGE